MARVMREEVLMMSFFYRFSEDFSNLSRKISRFLAFSWQNLLGKTYFQVIKTSLRIASAIR
jgi:hypothetical protein